MNRFAVVAAVLFLSLSGSAQEETCRSVQWTRGPYQYGSRTIWEMAAVDYDEDGNLDLVGTIQFYSWWDLVWWKGEGDGRFREKELSFSDLRMQGWIPMIAIADATGDGRSDVITIVGNTSRSYWNEHEGLLILPATGFGRGPALIKPLLTYFWEGRVTSITAVQWDADPAAEVILSINDGRRLDVYDDIATTPRLVASVSVQTEMTATGIIGADFDGDGRLDIAVAIRQRDEGGLRRLLVYFGKADGTFEMPVALPSIQPFFLTAADLNEDGRLDFVASNFDHSSNYDKTPALPASIYLNQGGRRFLHSEVPLTGIGPNDVTDPPVLEDFSGDGHLDLLVGAFGGTVATAAGRGDGTFLTPSFQRLPNWRLDAVGDFDGDGKLELAMETSVATSSCATQVALNILPSVPYSASAYGNTTAAIPFGQEITVSVKVSGFGPDLSQPLGMVFLLDGKTFLASSPVSADGQASFVVAGLAVGRHLLTAVFDGNPVVPAAPSSVVAQNVVSQPTSISVRLPDSPVYGVYLRFPVDGIPSGHPYVVDVDGVETRVFNPNQAFWLLEPGSHTIIATFEGTSTVPPARSAPVTFTVAKGNPILELNSPLVLREARDTVTLVISGYGVRPTGSVQLFEGTSTISSSALVNGSATLDVALSRGVHHVRAVYSGDTRYANVARDLTFEVIPNQPFPIDAQAVADGIRIVYLLPPTALSDTLQLHRRPAGATEWAVVPGWNPDTGLDASVPLRGVTYEYRLLATFKNASRSFSMISSATLPHTRRRAVSPP
jgi:hypothetical protein